jgi:hypothetical protein
MNIRRRMTRVDLVAADEIMVFVYVRVKAMSKILLPNAAP